MRNYGFPYRAPNVPRGVEVPKKPSKLGANYDTEWARKPVANAARAVITEGPLRLMVRGVASPEVTGLDRLDHLTRLDDPPPVIFTPNHHSHLDTSLMIRSIPRCWRRKLVVAAAADYFFDKQWKAALSALSLNAIPIDREVTGRKSSDMFRDLIADGHSLLIYPEGGRSPDGWGQEFKGGAAYLSSRSGAPVVPVFIDGTGPIFGKGMKRPKPGRTKVDLRCAAVADRRREHAPLQRPHRGRRHPARRRGARPTTGPRPGAPRSGPARRSPAPSTTAGAASGSSANTASSAPPASAAARSAAGPISARAPTSARRPGRRSSCCTEPDRQQVPLAGIDDREPIRNVFQTGLLALAAANSSTVTSYLLATRVGLSPSTIVCVQPTPDASVVVGRRGVVAGVVGAHRWCRRRRRVGHLRARAGS